MKEENVVEKDDVEGLRRWNEEKHTMENSFSQKINRKVEEEKYISSKKMKNKYLRWFVLNYIWFFNTQNKISNNSREIIKKTTK